MKNCVQLYGDAIDVVAPTGGMVSGNVYVFGAMVGVAGASGNAGDKVALWVVGVFAFPKTAGLATTMGQKVYWNAGTGKVTSSAGDAALGVATSAQIGSDTTVNVRLGGAF